MSLAGAYILCSSFTLLLFPCSQSPLFFVYVSFLMQRLLQKKKMLDLEAAGLPVPEQDKIDYAKYESRRYTGTYTC